MSPSQRALVSPCKPKPKTFETARLNAECPFMYPKAALKDYLICDGSSDLCESKHTTQSDASFERWTKRASPLPPPRTRACMQQRPEELVETLKGSDRSEQSPWMTETGLYGNKLRLVEDFQNNHYCVADGR